MANTETKYATIVVSAVHGRLGVVRNTMITSNTINTIKIKFDFRTRDWDGLTKNAVFYNDSTGEESIVVSLDSNDECFIPHEMMDENNRVFFAGVYGSNTPEKRLVSNYIKFEIVRGSYEIGATSRPPTPDIYEQLLSKFTYSAGDNIEIDSGNVISAIIPDSIATKDYVDERTSTINTIKVNGLEQPITNKTVDLSVITTETDPTVPSWAKQPSKPTYTAEEVGALPSTTIIPDAYNDSELRGLIAGKQNTLTAGDGILIDGDTISVNIIEDLPAPLQIRHGAGLMEEYNGSETVTINIPDAYNDSELRGLIADKYTKPDGGITSNDLSADINASLSKADSALQSIPSTYRTASDQDAIDATKVSNDDSRLTDARAPLSHAHTMSDITDMNVDSIFIVKYSNYHYNGNAYVAESDHSVSEIYEAALSGKLPILVSSSGAQVYQYMYSSSGRYAMATFINSDGTAMSIASIIGNEVMISSYMIMKSVNNKTPTTSGNITLTAADVGALPNTTEIPESYNDTEVRGLISNKYTKPDTGIPASDLEESYSLSTHNHDDKYLQSFTETDPTVPSWAKSETKPSYAWSEITDRPSIPDEVTESVVSGWGFTKNTGTYSKPSGGIPSTDLAESYSLSTHNHDETYLKSYTETDPTVPAWAKATTKPTYTWDEIAEKPSDVSMGGSLQEIYEDIANSLLGTMMSVGQEFTYYTTTDNLNYTGHQCEEYSQMVFPYNSSDEDYDSSGEILGVIFPISGHIYYWYESVPEIVYRKSINKGSYFSITEDIVTVTLDATKGVAPYSTSYGMTYIEIDKDAGIEWVEGALYAFIVNTKMVVSSSYRNVAIRIGGDDDGDVWHPLMTTSSIAGGSSYLTKAYNTTWQYKTVYHPEGALHLQTDNNTTYAYLVNTIVGDATASPIKIDDNGYGARYSLCFATTPLSDENGIVVDERWSSLVKSYATGTTKVAAVPKSGKFYIDRNPIYLYSASVAAGAMPTASVYQNYNGMDLRYTANINSTYLTRSKKVFLWLKNFNEEDMSFEADATVGNIMSLDKISTRFPSTVEGDIYLYFLGWNTATWYYLSPNFSQTQVLYKYTPSTGKFVAVIPGMSALQNALTGVDTAITRLEGAI